MKQKRNSKRKIFLEKALRFHGSITMVFLVIYLVSALIFDPRFLISDFRNKSTALAETVSVSLRVPGLPGKPTLSAETGCSGAMPYVELSWNSTEDSQSYDVYRNNALLVSDLENTSYLDQGVSSSTSYTYYIVAKGLVGETSSDEISVETNDCLVTTPPDCRITGLNKIDLLLHFEIQKITDATPEISGTSNIPNALVNIIFYGNQTLSTSVYANENGYWNFQVTEKLKLGYYNLSVIAIDPSDSTRRASDSLTFRIVEKNEEKETKKTNSVSQSIPSQQKKNEQEKVQSTTEFPQFPFSLSLSVDNPSHTLYAGEDISATLRLNQNINSLSENDEKILYQIRDANNQVVWETTETSDILSKKVISQKFPTSRLLTTGKYRLIAKMNYAQGEISSEDYFFIQEVPLVSLGGITLTLTQFLKILGWILWLLLLILVIFLFLLGLEHNLSRRALFQITEKYLRKKGFISRRKGVLK